MPNEPFINCLSGQRDQKVVRTKNENIINCYILSERAVTVLHDNLFIEEGKSVAPLAVLLILDEESVGPQIKF